MPKLTIVKVKLDREVNGYVVSCASTKEAVVIDPGLPVEKIAERGVEVVRRIPGGRFTDTFAPLEVHIYVSAPTAL